MGEPFFKPTPENTPSPESEVVIMDGNLKQITEEDLNKLEGLYGVPFAHLAHQLLGSSEYSLVLESTDAREAFIDAVRKKFRGQERSNVELATDEWNARYMTDPDFRQTHGDPDADPGELRQDTGVTKDDLQ